MSITDPKNLKASHGDDHDTAAGADPASVARGYEEDISNISAIWSIPIAVGVFLVLGLIVATGTFIYFMNVPKDPLANPVAAERNAQGTNERLARMGRAGQGSELSDQPRLEGLQKREGEGVTTSRPPLPVGNSPQIHPEDIRANRVELLQKEKNGWVEQGKVARISIDEAMKLAIEGHLFPVRKDPVMPLDSFQKAASSNAGRGGLPVAPAPKEKGAH